MTKQEIGEYARGLNRADHGPITRAEPENANFLKDSQGNEPTAPMIAI
jgi:hypothetical protein